MKEFKRNEGITLIALIITIIILVILAAVSVRAITNMKIVEYATNGSKNYVRAGKEENKILDGAGTTIQDAIENLDAIQYNKRKELKIYENGTSYARIVDATFSNVNGNKADAVFTIEYKKGDDELIFTLSGGIEAYNSDGGTFINHEYSIIEEAYNVRDSYLGSRWGNGNKVPNPDLIGGYMYESSAELFESYRSIVFQPWWDDDIIYEENINIENDKFKITNVRYEPTSETSCDVSADVAIAQGKHWITGFNIATSLVFEKYSNKDYLFTGESFFDPSTIDASYLDALDLAQIGITPEER